MPRFHSKGEKRNFSKMLQLRGKLAKRSSSERLLMHITHKNDLTLLFVRTHVRVLSLLMFSMSCSLCACMCCFMKKLKKTTADDIGYHVVFFTETGMVFKMLLYKRIIFPVENRKGCFHSESSHVNEAWDNTVQLWCEQNCPKYSYNHY